MSKKIIKEIKTHDMSFYKKHPVNVYNRFTQQTQVLKCTHDNLYELLDGTLVNREDLEKNYLLL